MIHLTHVILTDDAGNDVGEHMFEHVVELDVGDVIELESYPSERFEIVEVVTASLDSFPHTEVVLDSIRAREVRAG